MSAMRRPLTVLVVGDYDDDRTFIRKAWEKSRIVNDLRSVFEAGQGG